MFMNNSYGALFGSSRKYSGMEYIKLFGLVLSNNDAVTTIPPYSGLYSLVLPIHASTSGLFDLANLYGCVDVVLGHACEPDS